MHFLDRKILSEFRVDKWVEFDFFPSGCFELLLNFHDNLRFLRLNDIIKFQVLIVVCFIFIMIWSLIYSDDYVVENTHLRFTYMLNAELYINWIIWVSLLLIFYKILILLW